MPSKEILTFIRDSLNDLKEGQKESNTLLKDTSKEVIILGQKIIQQAAEFEGKYQEVKGDHIELKKTVDGMNKKVEYMSGWVGKIVFLFSVISFVSMLLGINGIDLIKKIFNDKKVDNVYADAVKLNTHE